MKIPHAKRFAARTVEQLHALRAMLEQYVAAHWRQKHATARAERHAAGERLIAVQNPEVRLDCTMARLTQIVDRVMNPPLPDNCHHGWR